MMTGLRQRPTGRRSQSCLGELKRGFKRRIIDKSALCRDGKDLLAAQPRKYALQDFDRIRFFLFC